MKIAALKILILGGTQFLGIHLTEELINHGHEVTLFNRGTHSIDFPVQQFQGNRDGNLEALQGYTWDAVIDTSGHVPRIVEQSAKLLAESTNHYTFISTIGVYEDFDKLGIDETYPIAKLEDAQTEEITEKNDGALKGLCEAVVHKYFPKNSLIIRPGLIAGPHDPTDRFTYWPIRISEGGEVLAPAHQTIQFIDVRDLAKWIVQMVEQQSIGIYNAAGTPIRFDSFLDECQRVTHSTAHINWVSDDFLIKKKVHDWSELPLWLSKERQMPRFMHINSQKAINAGLSFCSLAETISSILQWNASREPIQLKAGLDPIKESNLLMEWGKYSSADNQEKLVFKFAPAEPSQKILLCQWFEQRHIKEWMHGVGLQNTLNGLEKFFQGESDTTYWIGYDKDIPFAFLITSPEGSDATTLDLFICDLNYLGKGIAVPMIQQFLISQFSNMEKVLIDPEATNKRAIHVYQKVGFKIIEEFIASWHPVPHYQMELDMKDLLNLKTKKIVVTAYNPDWPKAFDIEASKIKETLGSNCIAIHHIGSTSVPGLSAKPVIDMIGIIKDPEKAIKSLEDLGFKYKGEYNIPMRFYFNKSERIEVNLHIYEEGHPEIELNLVFRDYLRFHPDALDEYARLKKDLLKEKSSYEKNNSLFTGYNLGKDAFIRKILQAANFNRIRMMKCTHYAEWEVAKRLRNKYFFDPLSISDPYTWTFDHPEHVHLVLYEGVEIIGYAHIQFWPNHRAALRIIVIDDPYQHQGLGSHFLKLCEQWLKKQGIKSLHDEARPDVVNFYRKNGFVEMPFNDPSGEPPSIHDLAMGKLL